MTTALALGVYIDTPTARNIEAFAEKVKISRRCGWIKGMSGVGKTAVINHLATKPSSYAKIITVLKTNAALIPFLKSLGQVIGCNAVGQGAKAIYDKLEDFMTPDSWGEYHRDFACDLLFIDEAQHIDLDAIRVVLELQKISRIPIVFLSNEERLQKTRLHDPSLKQVSNRIPFRLSLDAIHPGDIQAFGVAYNVEGTSAYHYLGQFGLTCDLHEVRFVLDEARAIAGPKGPIALSHLREAVTLWRGEDRDRGLFKLIPKPKQKENAA